MIYIPKGFAHGFITLRDNTEIVYQMSEFFTPEAGRGIRWNDPTLKIQWPEQIRIISDRDKHWPDYLSQIAV
jgi:dTDP-4-dehydrorhamnose 3,5-epimerase